MTLLSTQLPFPSAPSPSLPPSRSHLLITSSLAASADFALAHVLGAGVKDGRGLVLLDLAGQGEGQWKALGRKMNWAMQGVKIVQPSSMPLSTLGGETSLTPPLYNSDDEIDLRPLYQCLAGLLPAATTADGPILIIDNLDKLLDLGAEVDEVVRFFRALRILARKARALLVTHLHADALDHLAPANNASAHVNTWDDQLQLLTALVRAGGGWWWRVGALQTGRSGVVMGEISSHPLHPLPIAEHRSESESEKATAQAFGTIIPRANPLQYRLSETGIEVFAKGTGKGFL